MKGILLFSENKDELRFKFSSNAMFERFCIALETELPEANYHKAGDRYCVVSKKSLPESLVKQAFLLSRSQ